MDGKIVWRNQLLTVLAVTVSTVSGFAVPQTFQKSQLADGAPSLHEIFRLARDEIEVNSTYATEIIMDGDCTAVYECLGNSGLSRLTQHIFLFEFENLTESLPTSCTEIEAFSCDTGDCLDRGVQRTLQVYTTIANWVCIHYEDFSISFDCWADPFAEQLKECVKPVQPHDDTHVPRLRQCFADTVQGLSNCNIRDRDFFLEFSNFVLDEEEKMMRL